SMTTASADPMQEPATASAAAVAAKKKNRARPYVVLTVVVCAAIAIYLVVSWVGRGKESTDDAQVDADVVTVSARVGGAVAQVQVSDNQAVKKGDLLVEIDSADLAAKVRQNEAELAAAQAQAAAADAQVSIVEATSKGGLSAARAMLSGSATSVLSAG